MRKGGSKGGSRSHQSVPPDRADSFPGGRPFFLQFPEEFPARQKKLTPVAGAFELEPIAACDSDRSIRGQATSSSWKAPATSM